MNLSFQQLRKIKGLSRAASLIAGFELSKRIFNKGEQSLPKIEKPEDAVAQATYLFRKKKGIFYCSLLEYTESTYSSGDRFYRYFPEIQNQVKMIWN